MKLDQTTEDATLLYESTSADQVERTIESADALEADHIQDIVLTISQEEKRRQRLVWFLAAFCLSLAFVIAYVSDLRGTAADSETLDWLLPIGASFALFLPVAAAVIASLPKSKLKNAMQALARHGTVRDIDRLIETQRSLVGRRTKTELRKTLATALLQVRASDKDKISESSWKVLHRILSAIATGETQFTIGRHVDFYEAVIKAMEQVGDERALKSMERIANMKGKSAARQRLRQAAVDCLPALRLRVRETSAPETLLRATGADSGGELLRPTSGMPESDSELLLRPGGEKTE